MKRLFAASLLLLTALPLLAASKASQPEIIPLEKIRTGMRGVALTVFEGTKPEEMGVEVLGVLRNMYGPKGDIILVRLHGAKVEYTGVVAGMSGSPVYFDGKLAGAVAFRFGEFSKEPLAGVTPIEHMLEINEIDESIPPAPLSTGNAAGPVKTSGAGESPLVSVGQYLRPIGAPLAFSGFTEDVLRQVAPQFAAAGVIPVMGAGSASPEPQPEPLVPGSAVSAVLVRGDMNIAATCTVTYVDPTRLLACGHPLLQFGRVSMPMNKAHVLATLPSPANAFKFANATEPVGAFVQDRHTGIMGRFDLQPDMIPVTLTVHGGARPKQYKYEVLNNGRITPIAMLATVLQGLQGVNEYGEDVTYRVRGSIAVAGYPDVTLENMYSPMDGGMPAAMAVAASMGDRFSRIYTNPTSQPRIEGVELDVDLVRERRFARLESARTDLPEARPGDEIIVETVLRPYRGERIVRQIPVRIPTSTPRGTLRILVSDGDTLDRVRRLSSAAAKLDLGSTIALLNKEHANSRLYVSLLEPNPQAMIEDKVMPGLPLSVMNVMDGMRGTRDMVVVGESAVHEASTPLDHMVSGAQIITVTIK